ncbi:MAG: GNAT family N-acetyltransferase [Myxococcota bacterium]|nr:GNAT family N-acetyltransferase [Myxococcota bacterium]
MSILRTPRLELVPLTLAMVEAVLHGHREDAEAAVGAKMPERWPNRELVERAFTVSLDAIQARPLECLWGGRVLIGRGRDAERRVLGSVVFHGEPGDDGVVEVAYGVEEASQGQGYATEAVDACVGWALLQRGVRAVQAATFPWHRPSLRVIAKLGMVKVGTREHETLGELLVFERKKAKGAASIDEAQTGR